MPPKGLWLSPGQFMRFEEHPRDLLTSEIATRQRSPDFYALGMYLPDPDPILRKEGKDLKVYKELLADSRVGACVESRKAAVKALEWEVGRSRAKSRQAKFVQSVFDDLDIDRIIGEVLNAPLYGYQPLEVLWGQVGASLVPQDVVAKPSEWFVFDLDNVLRMRTKANLVLGEELPPRKFLLARNNPTYEAPYGERVLSRVFWPVVFKKGGLKFWLTFMEKFGIPYLVGKHPRGMDKNEIDALADRLEEAVQDAVLVVPDDASVEIKQATNTATSGLFKDLKLACDEDIAIALLGQNLTTSVSGGSRAAAEVHERVRGEIKDGDKKIVRRVMNELIKWICALNFGGGELPTFDLYEEDHIDQTQADRDKKLVDTGLIRFTKKYWLRTYDLEDDDIEMVAQPSPPIRDALPQPGLTPGDQATPGEFAETAPHTFPDQARLDEAAQGLDPAALQAEMEGVFKPVRTLIERGGSLEEIIEGLGEAYPDMDDQTFQERLTRAVFVSDVWGRLNAKS